MIRAAFETDDRELHDLVFKLTTNPYYTFEPRIDLPEEYDEQTSFVNSDFWFDREGGQFRYGDESVRFAICLGGTGSGKTISAAHKTAKLVLETAPPRERCPFWVIGETYELACGVCWVEKLSQLIPPEQILHASYINAGRNWPSSVLLRHPDNPRRPGWVLDFKSYAQGRDRFQAASIGGYWFNESAPMSIVEETQGRCRDYNSPGWADFTPLDFDDPNWPRAYEKPPAGWRFYHLNTEKNTALAEGWADDFLSKVPEDMRETRRIGMFATFRGMVFKEWRHGTHVVDPFDIPRGWHHYRGIDFGANNPFACVWVARSPRGEWYVYDEHAAARTLLKLHADEIHRRKWDYGDPHYGRTWSDHDLQSRLELSQYDIHCTPANKSVIAGIELLRSLMMVGENGRPKFYVFSNCEKTIDQIQQYRWPESRGREGNERNPGEEPIDWHNDFCDAVRYCIFSETLSQMGGGKPQHRKFTKKVYKDGGYFHGGR